MIAYYSQLAYLRQQTPVLRTGDFTTLLTGDTTASTSDNNTYAFARSSGGQAAVVALNNGTGSNTAAIPVSAYFADGTTLQDALSGATYTVSGGTVGVTLAARSGMILLPEPASTDTTAPSASITISPAPNSNGWNNGPVTAALSGSDSGSGVKELRYWVDNGNTIVVSGANASVAVSTDGTTINVRAVDQGNNVSPLVSTTVRIDSVPPTISGTAAPSPNAAGWNNTDVTVTWNCDDLLSEVASCPPSSVISGEGSGLAASGSVSDQAGNTASATVTANIDRTSPVVTVTGVSNGATYSYDSVPAASCSTTDTLSGVATAASLALTGGNSDGTGTFTATCTGAYDNAGNAAGPVSVTYTVTRSYAFTGFFQPVDNTPTFNAVSAGRGIPVKFSLNGDQGLNIFAAGYPVSQRVTCPSSSQVDTVEQTVTTSTSGLTYDAATDTDTYLWKTEKSWAGTCRQLTVRLSDGSDHVALFKFNK